MKGYYEAICDRCRTGPRVDDGMDSGPVRKQTCIRTSSLTLVETMRLPCERQEAHVRMEGRTKQLRSMQNYEEGFVRQAANAIYVSMDESWRKKEIAKIMASLRDRGDRQNPEDELREARNSFQEGMTGDREASPTTWPSGRDR